MKNNYSEQKADLQILQKASTSEGSLLEVHNGKNRSFDIAQIIMQIIIHDSNL